LKALASGRPEVSTNGRGSPFLADGRALRPFLLNKSRETAMLRVTVAAVAILVSQAALAANPTCEAQATEKKLAGAAKTSFVTKCEKDMKAATAKTCDAQAAEKKLSGAAKTSFTKKCVADATAPAPAPAK
jgi:hypothetical protein